MKFQKLHVNPINSILIHEQISSILIAVNIVITLLIQNDWAQGFIFELHLLVKLCLHYNEFRAAEIVLNFRLQTLPYLL